MAHPWGTTSRRPEEATRRPEGQEPQQGVGWGRGSARPHGSSRTKHCCEGCGPAAPDCSAQRPAERTPGWLPPGTGLTEPCARCPRTSPPAPAEPNLSPLWLSGAIQGQQIQVLLRKASRDPAQQGQRRVRELPLSGFKSEMARVAQRPAAVSLEAVHQLLGTG